MAQRRPLEAEPDYIALEKRAAARLTKGRIAVNLREYQSYSLDYSADVDLLTIHFTEHPHPTRSKGDAAQGIVYNYDGDTLVSVEIADILDVYSDAAA